MSNAPESARRNQFASSEQRDIAIKQEIAKERAAVAAKTAKLRALRLAKEETERAEAERRAAEKAQSPAKASRRKQN
jgi:hypothetical protein